MRLADFVLRRGHLSEASIIDAVMSGQRPAHLERCDLCADRAVELGRWLDETRALGLDAADAVFSPDQLAAQRAQILRRLEQLDEPARVISFPRFAPRVDGRAGGRRVAVSWVAVAAAAGLVIGVIGGQYSARVMTSRVDATLADTQPAGTPARPIDTSFLQSEYEEPLTVRSLELLDEITPRVVQARIGG